MVNQRCPRCGSPYVQLVQESSKHGCLWLLFFGIYYAVWMLIRWMIGFLIFIYYDWWVAILKACMGKSHVWQSKRWFSNRRRVFYCHSCGYQYRS